MKKFIIKIIIYVLIFGLLGVVYPIVIDPYNVFHAENIRDNGVEPNKNFIKMSYVMNNPDKFDAFIFGSSRVGALHGERLDDYKCYNMTYSMGTPHEHLDNIKSLVDANIIPKCIIIGVDSYSYSINWMEHDTDPLRCPYEVWKNERCNFYSLYCNPLMVSKSLKQIRNSVKRDEFTERFYKYGWEFDYTDVYPEQMGKEPVIGKYSYVEDTLNDIRGIKELCDQHNIKLVVFTNPVYEVTFQASVDMEYESFLKGLVEITDFYNFSGINSVTSSNKYYCDDSHYNAYVGDMILDVISGKSTISDELIQQNFGVLVTKENANSVITNIVK